MDFAGMAGSLFSPILGFFASIFNLLGLLAFSAVAVFFGGFFVRYRLNPLRLSADRLRNVKVKYKYYDFMRWLLVDFLERDKHAGEFREYGFTFYVGPQGSGKTTGMVDYLNRMKLIYPDCVIVTNFHYDKADYIMKDWRDIINVRNGTAGVIFAIDEIHSEYSAASWKDVPESLLSEISQQRKQRVKIVATAQYFGRIAKPLREQAFSVVTCECWAGRMVTCREYDAVQYAAMLESMTLQKKLRPMRKYRFISSDELRGCFDTYEKIERMRKMEFLPRDKRGE